MSMKTPIGKETDFIVPFWSTKDAREVLDMWTDEHERSPSIHKIDYSESNWIVCTVFTVNVWGDARKVNEVTDTIGNQLRRL